MVSFQQLRQADSASLRTTADGARKLARELEQYGADTDRHRVGLTAAWVGADSDAASHRLATHTQDFGNTAQSYGRVDHVVSTLAGEIDASKQMLESAVAMAPQIPGHVGEDGSVHVNWSALGSNPSPAAVAAAQQRAQQVAGYLRDAVMRANTADQRAQSELVALTGATNVRMAGTQSTVEVPPEGSDPQQVKQWWDDLSLEQQEQLITSRPHEIGALDGVPATARDQANRLGLDAERGTLTGQRTDLEERVRDLRRQSYSPHDVQAYEATQAQRELRDVNTRLENLDHIQGQLGRTDSAEQLYLLDYDSAADGQAVIAVGNPDTADHVVTFVPGTGADAEGLESIVSRSMAMQSDAAGVMPDKSTAAVAWLGYDAPNRVVPNAIFDHYYEDAGADLANFQQGLRATHEGAPSINTLMGHSYGASTIGYAAHNHDLQIDNLVQVASPGGGFSASNTAADYIGLDAENVWATRSSDDSIRWVSQIHGNDPIDHDFGGRVFPASDGGHSGYWGADNEARGHMANIITGQYDQVPHGRQDGAPQPVSN